MARGHVFDRGGNLMHTSVSRVVDSQDGTLLVTCTYEGGSVTHVVQKSQVGRIDNVPVSGTSEPKK